MSFRRLPFTAALLVAPILLAAQAPTQPATPVPYQPGLDPAAIRKPLADSWPTYSGDYTSRRYSALKQVDRGTVKNLTLAWTARVNAGNPRGTGTAFPMTMVAEVYPLDYIVDTGLDRHGGTRLRWCRDAGN